MDVPQRNTEMTVEQVLLNGTEALMSDYAAQIRPARGRRHSVK